LKYEVLPDSFTLIESSITAGNMVAKLQKSHLVTARITEYMLKKTVLDTLTNRSGMVTTVLASIPLLLAACTQAAGFGSYSEVGDVASTTGESYSDFTIVTVLPRDAIAAIDNPKFIPAEEANESYEEDELVLGVEFNGEARAYSIPMLSSHEIVNDSVGGVKIAVTW
jgi:hypothetical protein